MFIVSKIDAIIRESTHYHINLYSFYKLKIYKNVNSLYQYNGKFFQYYTLTILFSLVEIDANNTILWISCLIQIVISYIFITILIKYKNWAFHLIDFVFDKFS